MMNWLKRMLIFTAVAVFLLLPGTVGVTAEETTVPQEGTVQLGDYVYLGVDENGDSILWRCVAMREEGPLLVSHKVITYKAFDANRDGVGTLADDPENPQDLRDSYGSNNWKESTLRLWLNSAGKISWPDTVPDANHVTANPYAGQNGFLSSFTQEELALVKTVTNTTAVSGVDTPDAGTEVHTYSLDWRLENMLENYDTAFVQYTQDRFFCLNTPEVIALGTNNPDYEIAYPTDYARTLCGEFYVDDVGATYYWLRDAYAYRTFPEGVRCMYPGSQGYYFNAYNGDIGVRPAFVLEQTTFSHGMGTIQSPWCLSETPRSSAPDSTAGTEQDWSDPTAYVGTAGVSEAKGAHATIAIGDYITMGVLDGEPILWRCVDIDKNGPLMLSDRLLRFYAFDAAGTEANESDPAGLRKQYGSNRWSTSSLRHWLNSALDTWGDWEGVSVPAATNLEHGYSPYDNTAGFLTAFTNLEMSMIKEVSLESLLHLYDTAAADSGSEVNTLRRKLQLLDNYETAYKEMTTDKIFLMDRVQANTVYELFEEYILGKPTAGAVAKSDYKSADISVGKSFHYWLRDAFGGEEYPYYTFDVTTDGRISSDLAYSSMYGVRPCFYLDINALRVVSGTGTESDPYVTKSHDFTPDNVLVAPNCEQVGRAQRTCTVCGLVETFLLEAPGHSFETEIIPESLFFQEKTYRVCTTCGIEYRLGGKAKPSLVVAGAALVALGVGCFFIVKKLRGRKRR